jgi:hypothetical protein
MADWLKRQQSYSTEDVKEDLAFQEANQDAWYNWHLNKMKGDD